MLHAYKTVTVVTRMVIHRRECSKHAVSGSILTNVCILFAYKYSYIEYHIHIVVR